MRLDDTILDNPSAEQQFSEVVDDAMKEGIIDKNANVLLQEIKVIDRGWWCIVVCRIL